MQGKVFKKWLDKELRTKHKFLVRKLPSIRDSGNLTLPVFILFCEEIVLYTNPNMRNFGKSKALMERALLSSRDDHQYLALLRNLSMSS